MNAIAIRLLDSALALLLGAAWRIVKSAVAVQERQDLTGAQKRARAVEVIATELRMTGRALADSLVNLGIEAAVQIIRKRMN
ncbi:MAG: hypothetical protein WAT67_07935 [Candidatus Contendobacter sp.]